MKETSLKAENFIMYVKKATEYIPILRFSVGCSWIVLKACPNSKLDWAPAISKECRPPTSNIRRFQCFSFEALPAWICFKLSQLIGTSSLYILCKYKANPCRKSFKRIHWNLLLFDVRGLHDVMIKADDASRRNLNFQLIICNKSPV